MSRRRASICALASFALVTACTSRDDAARSDAPADTAAMALEQFDPAAFDTVSWPSDSAMYARGNIVFSVSCSKCHGITGAGDGGFVMDGDTLRPPSFRVPDWRFASDLPALRQQIFTGSGNNAGMPHWGLEGLKPRDIDATARFIQDMLRRNIN